MTGRQRATQRSVALGRTVGLLTLAAVSACHDATSPSIESLAGDYEAATLTVFDGNEVHDVVMMNGGAGLTLHHDGSTTGAMLIPPPIIDSAGTHISLNGSWVVDDSLIVFTPSINEVIAATAFRLRPDGSFAGGFNNVVHSIAVRFVRQGNCRTRECS